jgi:hypothetical protein
MTSLTDPQSDRFSFSHNHEGQLTEADLPNDVVTANPTMATGGVPPV